MYQIAAYWVWAAVAILGMVNGYFLLSLWSKNIEDINVSPEPGKLMLKPSIITILVCAAFGMLAFGVNDPMSNTNTSFHGKAEATIEALETETRAAKEVVTRTKNELDKLRAENARLRSLTEAKKFKEDVKSGEESMMDTRKRLLNRGK